MRRIFFMALLLLTYAASGAEVSKNESVPGWDSIDTSQDCVVILDKSGPTAALTCVTNKLVAIQQQMESLDNSSALKAATVALQRQFDSKLKAQQQQNDAAIAELKQQNEVLQQAEEQGKQLSAQVQALQQQVEETKPSSWYNLLEVTGWNHHSDGINYIASCRVANGWIEFRGATTTVLAAGWPAASALLLPVECRPKNAQYINMPCHAAIDYRPRNGVCNNDFYPDGTVKIYSDFPIHHQRWNGVRIWAGEN